MKSFLTYQILKNLKRKKDKKAIIFFNAYEESFKELTYQELYYTLSNFIDYLLKQGIKRDDHLIVLSNNSLELALIFLAALFLNLTIIPLPPNTPLNFLENVKRITKAKNILTAKDLKLLSNYIFLWKKNINNYFHNFLLQSEKELEKLYLRKPYIISFSSGSTGNPKPVVFSKMTKYKRILLSVKKFFGLTKDDNIIFITPLYHSLAQRFLLTPLFLGSTCIFTDKYNLDIFLQLSVKFNISFAPLVSTQVEDILSLEKKLLYSLPFKYILSSSNTLKDRPREIYLNIKNKVKFELFETYGTSELGFVSILSLKKEYKKYKSVGKPLPYVKVKIDGEKVGEILCKSETLFEGYYGRKDLYKKYFDKEGYFKTGDLGYLDEDGYLYFKGRKKDLIISGGINIYPEDIEKIIKEHPKVKEVVVFGYPHERLGEIVCSVIKAEENLTKMELYKYLRNKLLPYQIPQIILFKNEIPKTALGKYSRTKLKKIYAKEVEKWKALM